MHKMMVAPILGAFVLLTAPLAQAQEGKQKAPKQEVAMPTEAGVVRLKPEMDAVVAADAKPELLRDGFKKGLEGGVWVEKGGYLLFSNKPEQTINRWTRDGQYSVYLDLKPFVNPPGTRVTMASGMALDKEGRLVYCSAGEQAIIRLEADGKRTVLLDNFEGKRFVHPNDMTFRSDGSLYFSDQGDPPPGKTAEQSTGAYLFKDGKLRRIAEQLKRPNGLAMSADERTIYIADADEKKLFRFEILPDGSTGKPEFVIDVAKQGSIDGMRVDKAGRIYLGLPGGVWVVAPDGTHIGTIVIPDRVSNMAFGDDDLKTLYMMNHTTLYKIKLKAEGPKRW